MRGQDSRPYDEDGEDDFEFGSPGRSPQPSSRYTGGTIPSGVSAAAANALARMHAKEHNPCSSGTVANPVSGNGVGDDDGEGGAHVEFKGLTALLPARIRAPEDLAMKAKVIPSIPRSRSAQNLAGQGHGAQSRSGSTSAFSGRGLLPAGPHLPASRSQSIAA